MPFLTISCLLFTLDPLYIPGNYWFFCIHGNLFHVSLLLNSYLSNTNIWFSSTYCSFSWNRLIINSMLHFSNICQWDLGIIIFFNATIALVLQISRIWLINLYFILKLLVFASIGQLYYDKHLPQYYYSFLPSCLSYFSNGFFSPSNSS